MNNKKNLGPADLEKQEHLSLERVKQLQDYTTYSKKKDLISERPIASFVDLMEWALNNFSYALKDKENLNKFIHNKITMDGQFLQFAKENNLNVKCLYKDSIISWNSEFNSEKFFVQGVFLIQNKDVEFLHCALFHKGNQNEDEVSFFVICSNKNYDNYIKLRNNFDQWISLRDRENLHIRVIGAEDIPYTTDAAWEDLFLPETVKKEIKSLVEIFLSSQKFYLEKKIPWKRGIILYGQPGCGKSSIIKTLISEYDFKPVTIVPTTDINVIKDAFTYAEEQSPSLLYFEDLDSLIENGLDISTFLNLLDGISTKNGMLIVATANEINKLKANITQRPSRFDRKFEIPPPNADMAYIYLKKWFGTTIDNAKCKEISKYSEKYRFSYAYLKELYISTMFEALSNNRKTPTKKDIDKALSRLIQEKNILRTNSISTDKYFK